MVFDHHHYVPVLLAKRGERRGLGDLDPRVKAHLTPLFVVPPVNWDYEADAPAKGTDAHLTPIAKELHACWGTDRAFLDPYFLDDSTRMPSGQHPLEFMIDQGNQHGIQLVPCVRPGRDGDYRTAAAAIHARDGRGACVRLGFPEWPSVTGIPPLKTLLDDLRLTPAQVDLVLDAGGR
jgi:hypothetical protein